MFEASAEKTARKILVVDDEPSIVKLIQLQLNRSGYEVFGCLNSEQVVDKVDEIKPDLILMDMMMPNLDGISASKRVRNMALQSYIPIIMVTARREVHDVVAALDAGVDDYITKPIDFEELNARIKNMLRIKNLQDSLLTKTNELKEANGQITRLNQVLTDTNRQLQKKLYDLHNIFEISFKVMGEVDPHKLINTALLNALGIFTAKSALLLLLNPENQTVFEVVESKGFLKSVAQEFTLTRHDKLVHYLELVKRPFQITEVVDEFREIVPQLSEMEIRLIAPLVQNDEIVGVLCLGPSVTTQEYPPDVIELIGIISNMLSVALHNSQIFSRIKEMSYTDGMTGLHNYRFFMLRLKEELARARRNDTVVSQLIIDVDFFKNYNDTLGHPAGDEVLRQLSAILRSMVRDNDIVARYGGEEFAIILPATDRRGAVALGERIRKAVEKHHFSKEEIQPNGALTISIGVSTFPEDAVIQGDLVNTADQALYHAKNNGRNQVVSFSDIADLIQTEEKK